MAAGVGMVTLLLQQIQDCPADPSLKERLYHCVRGMLLGIARKRKRRIPCPSVMTEALVDDVFLLLLGKVAERSMATDEADFYKLAACVIWRRLADHARGRAKPDRLSPEAAAGHDDGRPGPQEEAEARERFLALAEAVDELERTNPRAAVVFKMRCLEDWSFGQDDELDRNDGRPQRKVSFEEIARHLEIGKGTAFRLWTEACQFLRARLQSFDPADTREDHRDT